MSLPFFKSGNSNISLNSSPPFDKYFTTIPQNKTAQPGRKGAIHIQKLSTQIITLCTPLLITAIMQTTSISDLQATAAEAVQQLTTPTETAQTAPQKQRVYLGKFVITGYCPCIKCCGIWSKAHPSRIGTDYIQLTSSGAKPIAGITCGASKAWAFGTEFEIDGLGTRIVQDRGGLRRDDWVDVFFPTHADAVKFARRELDIWVLR